MRAAALALLLTACAAAPARLPPTPSAPAQAYLDQDFTGRGDRASRPPPAAAGAALDPDFSSRGTRPAPAPAPPSATAAALDPNFSTRYPRTPPAYTPPRYVAPAYAAPPPRPSFGGSCTPSAPCVGPRGGLYYYSASGNRVYLRRR